MDTKTVYLESLGCARNQVDSDAMAGRLHQSGWTIVDTPANATAIVVNTCCFIESAADESIEAILTLAAYKTAGACRRLIVTGCLPERYREQTADALPEVDAFLGTGGFDQIVTALEKPDPLFLLPDPDKVALNDYQREHANNGGPSAYLKIAEGCDRHCTYCIIPRLRGRQKSRPPQAIISEAEHLVSAGVKELVLVAQESSHYGADLGLSVNLSGLLEGLVARCPEVWIRVLYGHPESFGDHLITTFARLPTVCSYFDIPIQHASDPILQQMGRRYRADDLHRLFERIKTIVPDAALRTTVMTGFPGESDQDFERLEAFVTKVRFDHLGAFVYSDADDLASHGLAGHLPADVSQARLDRIMTLQQGISLAKNSDRIGQTYPVLVEDHPESGLYSGRTPFQAPEVDGETTIESGALAIGQRVPVRITGATEYDLVGKPS